MVDVEPVGNRGHLYLCIRAFVSGASTCWRPKWSDVICFVAAVCIVAVELLYVGDKPRYELDACECGIGAQGSFSTRGVGVFELNARSSAIQY